MQTQTTANPAFVQLVLETRVGEYTPHAVFRFDKPEDFVTQERERAIDAGYPGAHDIDHWDKARNFLEKNYNQTIKILSYGYFLYREDWCPLVMEMAKEVGWTKHFLSTDISKEFGNDQVAIEKMLAEKSIPFEKKDIEDLCS